MAFFYLKSDKLHEVESTDYVREEIIEPINIQKWFSDNPSALGEDLIIIAKEFKGFENSGRGIDLLALDKEANLVVIELKRTDKGDHAELQALRYAAMVRNMIFEEVVQIYEEYLRKGTQGQEPSARERILKFVDFVEDDENSEPPIGPDPRIFLISKDFSDEIFTTVDWLIGFDLDIKCFKIQPYKIQPDKLDEKSLVINISQFIPLPQAEDNQIKLRQQKVDQRTDTMRARVSRRKGEKKLKILSGKGKIGVETRIFMTREFRGFQPNPAEKRFQAHFTDDFNKVVWEQDGTIYSLNKLTIKILEEETQRSVTAIQSTKYWSLAEDQKTTLDEIADEIGEE